MNGGYMNGGYMNGGYMNGGYMNGGYMNGGYMNGGYMNGGYMNGGYMNGGYMNGGYMNGGTVGGWTLGPMMNANNQPITNVQLVKDYLTGSVNGQALAIGDFVGATFQATVNDSNDQLAGFVTIKITGIKYIAGDDGTTHYQYILKWVDGQSHAETPMCGCENANPNCTSPVPATLVTGLWNYTQGTIDGGRKISNDPNILTMACAGGAISKCSSDTATQSPLTVIRGFTTSPAYHSWINYSGWTVYPGEKITITLTNVTGDPDLYVKFNGTPTGADFDCRSIYGAGTNESCTLYVPKWAYLVNVSTYGYSSGASASVGLTSTNAVPRGIGYMPYRQQCFNFWGSIICNTSPTYEQQTCTRMVTADYCGDGTPHTVNGRPIEVYDHYSPTVNTMSQNPIATYFESEWTPDGANNIGTCRVDDLDLSDADPNYCPVYQIPGGTYQHAVIHPMETPDHLSCYKLQFPLNTDRDGYLYDMNTGTYYPRQYARLVSIGY